MKSKLEVVVMILACCILAGCSAERNEITDTVPETVAVTEQADEAADISGIEQIFIEEYNGQEDKAKCVYKIIERLGSAGFIAIDSDNKVDMTNADKMRQFINLQRSGKHAEICVIRIFYSDVINILSITADKGQAHISQTYYTFQDDHLINKGESEYAAEFFEYTDEGYLMIEGLWHSPEQYVLTLSGEEEHIALRVDPLDDECRKLCEKYVAPVSYDLNNMFITDWNEDDHSDLDLYDVFEKFYSETYGMNCPYTMNDNLSVGNEYEISADEFENVIMRHFKISPEELHKLLRYDADKNVYLYRPRGFEEFDYAEIPYPEVAAYEKNSDGSMTLTVNAVYPNGNTSKLFSHKVTVADENEKVYYLSNEISGDEEPDLWWHADRLSDDEWKENYKVGDETSDEKSN